MAKLNHNISIVGAENGFAISVGCKTLVFKDSDVEEFAQDLAKLLTGGYKAEQELHRKYIPKDFEEKSIRAGMVGQAGCEAAATPVNPGPLNGLL